MRYTGGFPGGRPEGCGDRTGKYFLVTAR